MNVMKRFTAAIMLLCMMLTLAACGSGDSTPATEAPVVTEAPTEAVPETEAATEAPTEAAYTYKVTVVDESGNPIAGAMVQLCMDTCFPGVTDATGAALFNVEEADYKVSFLALPAGYTYSTEEQEFHFADGSNELTITLKAEG